MVLAQAGHDLLDSAGCEVLPRGKHVPFVAVPTTAGTGSEATLVAVVANPAIQVKMEFLSYHLLPDVAVLDPRMTETLPPRITAATGFDALVHAIEAASFWAGVRLWTRADCTLSALFPAFPASYSTENPPK